MLPVTRRVTDHVQDAAAWTGPSETVQDVIGCGPCAGLAAALDRGAPPRPGEMLPPLWHWLYFLPLTSQADLGADGHARGVSLVPDTLIPDAGLPRRMLAGGEIVFRTPLRVGQAVHRRSSLLDIRQKDGRSGPLTFVRIMHDITSDDGESAITEHQHIVYRAAPSSRDPSPEPALPPSDPAWKHRRLANETLLFRYSALTFNSHRIHYDRPYAMQAECYPGLVVHGPLIATLLLESLHAVQPHARLRSFRFQVIRPTFDNQPFFTCGAPSREADSIRLWSVDHAGALTMDATAFLQ